MNFGEIIKLSRPRFWLYEAGSFLIGSTVAGFYLDPANWISFVFWFLYFLISANILIYGINDIFDYETDLKNPKKVEYESLLKPEFHEYVWIYIVTFNLPFIVFAFFFLNNQAIFWLLIFLFFAIFYSAWPIRAKIVPAFDSLFSAGHYIATAVFGYVLFSFQSPNYLLIVAGILWAMAMHAYSAIPDIEADKDTNIKTIAVWLSFKNTLYLCGILYIVAFLIGAYVVGGLFVVLAIPYIFLIYLTDKDSENIFKYYKYFPILNSIVGFLIFCLAVFLNYK